MTSFKILLMLALVITYVPVHAQVTVRDHRLGKGIRYIPRPAATRPTPSDKGKIPNAIDAYQTASYTEEIRFPGNGPSLTRNSSGVFFCGTLQLGSGSIFSSAAENNGRALLFYTDTLEIGSNFKIDLSKNRNDENGFLLISCRVLKLNSGSRLTVSLSDTQQSKYRKFYFYTEQVFLNGSRVFDEAKVLNEYIRHNDRYKRPVYYWRGLRVGEKPPTRLPPGFDPKPGYAVDTVKFNPLVITTGYLPVMIETNSAFYSYFSKWVAASYQSLYNRLLRNVNNFDKLPAVKDFIRFLSLNKYDQLEGSSQTAANQWIQRIMPYKNQVFSGGYQFERTLTAGDKNITLLATADENGITNYLPPAMLLVNPLVINNRTILGYHVFDASATNIFTLDFEVSLMTDSRLKGQVEKILIAQNEKLAASFDQLKFSNLTIEGPDIIPNQTTITPLSNNTFNIKLTVKAENILVFSRLFSSLGSPVFINGKWSAKNAAIGGAFRLPVSFSKISSLPVTAVNGGIENRSPFDVTAEFILNNNQVVEKSPALLIKTGSTYVNVFKGEDKDIRLPADALSYKLDAEKFGDYFEQIDNSDLLSQELYIENLIPASPADSLSGYLQYAELFISGTTGDRAFERKIQLSPASSSGSNYHLILPKTKKEAIVLKIKGTAYYENGEYTIKEVLLSNGEMQFNLATSHFLNNR